MAFEIETTLLILFNKEVQLKIKTALVLFIDAQGKEQLNRACSLKQASKLVSLVAHMLQELVVKLYATAAQTEEPLEMFVLVIFKRHSFFLLPQPLHPVIPKLTQKEIDFSG